MSFYFIWYTPTLIISPRRPLSFHAVSFGPSNQVLRRMADIAQDIQRTAPVDPMHPTVPSSYTEAIDTVSRGISVYASCLDPSVDSIGRNFSWTCRVPQKTSRLAYAGLIQIVARWCFCVVCSPVLDSITPVAVMYYVHVSPISTRVVACTKLLHQVL